MLRNLKKSSAKLRVELFSFFEIFIYSLDLKKIYFCKKRSEQKNKIEDFNVAAFLFFTKGGDTLLRLPQIKREIVSHSGKHSKCISTLRNLQK
ncbi:hypothetical protein [Enterococcus sp. 7E2_DIV0204]|uniref:hypothetical protein n=1 Tax=Enterococcus sp. 7E2_DIV0204 TaxID=1834188 RepID=UPI000A339508|nr:hypothetical protein [Enterococcus sp. 7E2_DIV0204]